ncbi:unnamed protein product [Arctogadus glacialis]
MSANSLGWWSELAVLGLGLARQRKPVWCWRMTTRSTVFSTVTPLHRATGYGRTEKWFNETKNTEQISPCSQHGVPASHSPAEAGI